MHKAGQSGSVKAVTERLLSFCCVLYFFPTDTNLNVFSKYFDMFSPGQPAEQIWLERLTCYSQSKCAHKGL